MLDDISNRNANPSQKISIVKKLYMRFWSCCSSYIGEVDLGLHTQLPVSFVMQQRFYLELWTIIITSHFKIRGDSKAETIKCKLTANFVNFFRNLHVVLRKCCCLVARLFCAFFSGITIIDLPAIFVIGERIHKYLPVMYNAKRCET